MQNQGTLSGMGTYTSGGGGAPQHVFCSSQLFFQVFLSSLQMALLVTTGYVPTYADQEGLTITGLLMVPRAPQSQLTLPLLLLTRDWT